VTTQDQTADLFAARELLWPDIRAWLQSNSETLLDDRSLLEEIGLIARGRNVVEFGRTALTKLEAVAEREADARKRIEDIARANFAAQTQTHVAALDLMDARSHSDLARRLDAAAQARFGLSAATIAVERPGGVPFGWKALEPGGVDAWLGEHGLTWLGPMFPELDLFGPAGEEVKSVALIRMALHLGGDRGEEARPALAAFGSPEPEGFTAGMGCELVAFVASVVARTAERWPVLD